MEPDGPRKVAPEILKSYGANLDTDFNFVGIISTAQGAGGFQEVREQKLLKPNRSTQNAVAACSAERKSKL